MAENGYLSPLYARSLAEYGSPLELSASQGSLLKRPIPGTSYEDGMGCYPIFVCKNWSKLGADLEHISSQLISVSMVTDPFGNYDHEDLNDIFDFVLPYKKHFVVDLHRHPEEFVAKHHQRNARKAEQNIRIETCEEPLAFLSQWVALYDTLIERHQITGITRFSHEVFARQFHVPGLVAFRAIAAQETVGMLLWYVQENIAYYHLGAYSPEGYTLNASFALFWCALNHFASSDVEWLNLGAGAGTSNDGKDGLTRFKRGWSTGTRQAYFCGKVFNPKIYDELVGMWKRKDTDYFPAYRSNEFE
jgi:hypothetical protein